MSDSLIELVGISKHFGGTKALDSVDWSLDLGEIHCLIGENGSGKSTLIKLISGVHKPESGGIIRIDGKDHDRLTPALSRQLGIQVIYQDLSLFPNLTVAENIAIDTLNGRALGTSSRGAMRKRARKVLKELDHELNLDAIVGTLNVAHRQIVAICRGLAVQARVLIMDEPTASLTRQEVLHLFTTVRRLSAMNMAVVFVSHRLDEVAEIAQRISILRDARMIITCANDDHKPDLSQMMSGKRIEHQRLFSGEPTQEVCLDVRALSRPGEFEDVSFQIHRGEVLGITGLLGAGRTELALALFGMRLHDSGSIELEGKPLRLGSNRDAIAAGIAYVSEDRLAYGLVLEQSIADNIALSVLDTLTNLYGLVTQPRRAELARSWVGKLDIKTDDVASPATTLSGGNQQRVVLAKWLAAQPRVLILDSPTVGVDIQNKQSIYAIIKSLADTGVAILLISDEVPEVYYNCHRVLHMRQQKLVGTYQPAQTPIETLNEAVYG